VIEVKERGKEFSEFLDSFVDVLREEIRSMEERIVERIEHRIDELVGRGNSEEGTTAGEVIILRSISREQAKKEILDLFDTYEKLDYGDIAEKLRLDLEQVVEIVGELKKEGEVEVAE
jgi:Mn-dependent DtxR family transcriptional regulator